MNLEPAPRLSKTTFLIIDAVLLVTAFVIVFFAKDPYATLPFISAVLCVALASIIGLIPFLIDYAADSAEYVQQERERVAEQVQRLHAAGESLMRAAAQIKAVEEAVHKTAHAAEHLPYRMQEKLAEFNQQLTQTDDDEKERLTEELTTLRQSESERLQTITDKIHKAAADWAALEVATRKQLTTAQETAAAKFDAKINAVMAALDAKLATFAAVVASAKTPPPASEPAVTPALLPPNPPELVVEKISEPTPAIVAVEPEPIAPVETPLAEVAAIVVAPDEPAPAETPAPASVADENKTKKPRAPRKSKPEDALAEMSPEPVVETVTPSPESSAPVAPDDFFNEEPAPQPTSGRSPESDSGELFEEPAEKIEAAASSDGATRLLATAYIGIGNKLFIRGDGPGLSWDKGVAMQFVSIGKWGWASHDATAPIRAKLYKNDDIAALSGEVMLLPGKHVETTALF